MAKIDKEINEALVEDILQIYADAEDKMLKAVAKRVAKGITTEGWNEIKLKDTQALKQEIEKLLSNTTKLSKSKVSKGILDAYKSGIQEVGGAKGTHKTVLDELDVPMNLKMLVLSTNNLLDNASFQVLRKANDAYQQVMANATTGLLAGTDTRMQASQKMLNEFASKGITTFVDKAGRNWDLGSYAEMCARTVSSHAALQGHIDRQLEVGEDLVKVSTIGTTCPICQRWQGVVLSISGNHPKYHSLDQAKATGLFHPNCKHTLGMFIPELDGEGKVEPDPINMNTESSKRNKLIEQQRANERNIRYWKKRKALALTPEEEKKCNEKIKAWQYKNLIHCEKNGLRRQYAREGVRTGNTQGPMGTFIGGNLKEYEEVFKNVVGEEPKKTFGMLKMNLQFFAEKGYETWLKDEITSLDDLDVEKAMMKDPNNKTVTPTSLYKKYIGDNPIKDFEEITLYVKGTKEFKSSYAKWLKEEIEEIGVSYKIKPKYTEVHEDIPEEDKKLSATEIYKKYHDGEKPTDAYNKLGGEAGTGMKYGKWVETQKKELIKNGITKTVPFDNATTQKTVDTISKATKTINDAKDVLKKDELDKYQQKLDNKVHGAYDGYLQVKEMLEEYHNAESKEDEELFEEKLKLAEKKHLEMVKKKAEKTWGTSNFDYDLNKLTDMLLDETDEIMHEHIDNQIQEYYKVKKEKEAEENAKKKVAEEAKKKAKEAAKKASDSLAKYDKLGKWEIDEAIKLMKKGEQKDLEETLEYYQSMLLNNDPSWEYYESVTQKVEMYKEAVEGTLGMPEEDKAAFLKKKKEEEEETKKKIKQATGNKVSIGREIKFDSGSPIKRESMYNELDLGDLENLSKQVKGHTLFENSNRRDILGRDRIDGHNHHRGHDVRIKSGLSKDDEELAKAFALAYDEYFNTIKCQPINLAYLNGYENATPTMKKKIDTINKCIQSVELNEPIKLYRFVDKDIVEAIFKTSDVHSIEMGTVFNNETFMSTATGGHPTFGKRKYMITLQCDKGTHALPTLNHEELEVLLGKGKLEFVRAEEHGKNGKPGKRMKNYDGSYTEFTGDEIIVRYIEEGKSIDYEKPTTKVIDKMLSNQTGTSSNLTHHTKDEHKRWKKELTSDEETSTVKYTSNYYGVMNGVLRQRRYGTGYDKVADEHINNTQSALRKASIDSPIILKRGMGIDGLSRILGGDGTRDWIDKYLDEINKGDFICEDKGFLSMTPEKTGGFNGSVEVRMYCPAGTHAAYVAPISHFTSEKETLLQSGSVCRVVKIKKSGNSYIAYLELLGTD